MNSLKYAIIETEVSAVETPDREAKLYLVPDESKGSENPVTRRVEAVLDFEFAHGRMPA